MRKGDEDWVKKCMEYRVGRPRQKEMEKECYEEEVQPYRKVDYKPIIYIYI